MSLQGELPRVWVIRAGRHGEDEDAALEEGKVILGFTEFDDLTRYGSVEELIEAYLKLRPASPRGRAEYYGRQLWAFREKIRVGDVAVLPLKTSPGQIAVGRVSGQYHYADVLGQKRHTRTIEWTHPDLPRSTFQQDLLYSFGAFITVCRVQRHDAEKRVQTVLSGQADPGPPAGSIEAPAVEEETPLEAAAGIDLAQAASDEITAFIRSRFPGH